MNRWATGILLLSASACDTGGPTKPEGTTATLTLMAPSGVERPDSLRVAVVWRTGQSSGIPWLTTFDSALSDTAGSHPVRVELPEGVNLRELPDPVSISVKCPELKGEHSWPGIRPLWVVYQDLNRNQRLDEVGLDRIWAVTDFTRNHLVAFADFEMALSQVSLEGAACLRQAVGGGYSPFVSGYGIQFYCATIPITELIMYLNPTDYPQAILTCGPSIQLTGSRAPVDEPTLLAAAPELDLNFCTDELTPCTRVAFEDDWVNTSQPLYIPGYNRWVGCVTVGALEVLWVREQQHECEDCICVPHVRARGWVVPRNARPRNWPCGESVETCATVADKVERIPADCLNQ